MKKQANAATRDLVNDIFEDCQTPPPTQPVKESGDASNLS